MLNIENSLNHDIQLAESMLLADDNNLDAMVSCELHYEDKNSQYEKREEISERGNDDSITKSYN